LHSLSRVEPKFEDVLSYYNLSKEFILYLKKEIWLQIYSKSLSFNIIPSKSVLKSYQDFRNSIDYFFIWKEVFDFNFIRNLSYLINYSRNNIL